MATSQEQEYFPVGSTVQCVTCLGETLEGEVVAFDHVTKLLALKSYRQAPGSKKSRQQQLQLINVNLVQDISVVQEAPPASSHVVVPNFNYVKLSRRAAEEATRKRRSICADSVSADGQKLFITIRKTIEDVQWKDGEHILVMSAVAVSPPYKSENVEIYFDNDQSHRQRITRAQAQNAAEHVKKIIDQFWLKQTDAARNTVSGGDSSESNRKSGSPESSTELKRSSSPS